jgi:hypothetical protein
MITTSVVASAIPALPNAVLENIIFSNLSLPELGTCSRVCKAWKEMAKKHINAFSHPQAFGPKEWYTYFGGYLKDVPRLTSKIAEIMNSPCPFWPDKKVHETHLLVLVPQTVSNEPLTLKTLAELVRKPITGNATKCDSFNRGEHIDSPSPCSHWVLMTRDVIEESRNKSYKDQQLLIEKQDVYEVPHILDAAVCIFMEYIRTGTRLYSYSRWIYTRCQEKYDANWQLVVGGFGPDGLRIDYGGLKNDGIGGCRKL